MTKIKNCNNLNKLISKKMKMKIIKQVFLQILIVIKILTIIQQFLVQLIWKIVIKINKAFYHIDQVVGSGKNIINKIIHKKNILLIKTLLITILIRIALLLIKIDITHLNNLFFRDRA